MLQKVDVMNSQVPICRKRVFNCLECDEKDGCKEWITLLEDQRIKSEEMMKEMPIIVEFFGMCGLKHGNIEKWKKKLEELSFGC